MAVDLFQKVDRSKVDVLPFIRGTFPFGYVDSKYNNRLGVIYEIHSDDFKKMKSLFNGKEEKKIGKGDRVFILSGCKIPQFKIKEFCRGVGAIMVSKIEDATVFVGNDQVSQDFIAYESNPLDSLSMIMDMTYVKAQDYDSAPFVDLMMDNSFNDYYPEGTNDAIFTKLLGNRKSSLTKSGSRQMYCITPYTARVVYEILARQIVTISEDCLSNQLPTSSKLDDVLCEQVMNMLASPDESNCKVAYEILANCDYSDAHFYLYKIARKYYWDIAKSRFKNIKLFLKESKLGEIYSNSNDSFIGVLLGKDRLTKEALEFLLPQVADSAYNSIVSHKSSVYNIKLELRSDLAAILGDHTYNKEIITDGKPSNEDE